MGRHPGADSETDVSITMGPALRNTFSADESIACGFRLPQAEAGDPPDLQLVIQQGERNRSRHTAAAREARRTAWSRCRCRSEGLASGDYTVRIEDVAEGGFDRGSLPIRIR